MSIDAAAFVEALRKNRLLEPAQLQELTGQLRARCSDPKTLAKELLRRGWLTAYQANQLLQGNGGELVVGPYVLLERLGEGGMGEVFKARHQKLRRVVALKLIRKERLANPDAVRRFQHEVRAAAQLAHPHVVHAYDADQVDGKHLLVMEYVEGSDLGKLVKEQGPLPVGLACESIRQAALGLQHAHERGLVHRDIKPANLLVSGRVVSGELSQPLATHSPLTTPHSPLTLKILDMGLARIDHSGTGDTSSSLTKTGSIMGTADFIAPEQARDSRQADIRSDIYSLGCTFYYLLTGRAPFVEGTATEKMLKHMLDEPAPVEQLRPEVPAGVATLVRKMMAKDPENRYQRPGEVAEAIARGSSTGEWPAAAGPPTLPVAPVVSPVPRAIPDAPTVVDPRAPARRPDRLVVPVADRPQPERPGQARRTRSLILGLSAALVLGTTGFVWFLAHGGGKLVPSGRPTLPASKSAQSDPGWAPLFNGKDLAGWKVFPKGVGNWKVDTGILTSTVGGPTVLFTERGDFENFHVRAEARVNARGDSGLFFRTSFTNEDPPHGYEAQIQLGEESTGGKTGGLMVSEPGNWRPMKKVQEALVLPDTWFTLEVIARGNQIQVKVNGQTTADWVDPERRFQKGHLALQHHTRDTVVQFRKVEVKELPAGPGAGPIPPKEREPALVSKKFWKTHTGPVTSLRFSDDGKVLATASFTEGLVRLWNVGGEKEVQSFPVPNVSNVRLASDGKVIASTPQALHVWDNLKGRIGEVSIGTYAGVTLPADGKTAAVYRASSGFVDLYDLALSKRAALLDAHATAITGLQFSPDGRYLVSSCAEAGELKVWEFPARKQAWGRTFAAAQSKPGWVFFAADSKTFIVLPVGKGGEFRVFDASTQQHLGSFNRPWGMVALAPGGRLVAYREANANDVRLLDTADGTERAFCPHGAEIFALALSADGKTLATGGQDGTVKLWDISSLTRPMP